LSLKIHPWIPPKLDKVTDHPIKNKSELKLEVNSWRLMEEDVSDGLSRKLISKLGQ